MKEIFKMLAVYKLTPNQLMVLMYFKDKEAPPIKDLHTDRRLLISGEWIKEDNSLTFKAFELIDEMNGLVKAKIKKAVVQLGNVSEDNVDKYLELFPKGLLPSGKPARVSKGLIKVTFIWFFDHHPYTWDTVLKATAAYIDKFELTKYLYMRNSCFFIRKVNPDKTVQSDLADWCAMIDSGSTEESSHHFSEKVV